MEGKGLKVNAFTEVDEAISFILNEKAMLYLITSGHNADKLLSEVHKVQNLIRVSVFCMNP
jgi:hypothetical protein